ncbi:hypothetical protein ACIGBH_41625 [Streptomyces sp. NPDC085929]|uniref:hypothetical protein n=1 Tax=Streptomyces sp. NPDC085929 TaxID=3365739 RepID=UPI0037D6459C
MGYDMYIEDGPDEAERLAVEEAHQRLKQARATGRGVLEAYQRIDAATRSYYRFRVWDMGTARELMGAFGMLTFKDEPTWPDAAAYTEARTALEKAPDDEAVRQAAEAARARASAAMEAVRTTDPGGPGIAHYKLCSNDAWLVSPREIETALKAYAGAASEDREEAGRDFGPWESWVRFLTRAQARGGFRVC